TGRTFKGLRSFPTTPGAYQSVNKGEINAFVTVLNAGLAQVATQDCTIDTVLYDNCNELLFSTLLGGSSQDGGLAVAAHPTGIVVTGYANSPDFPLKDALPKDSVNHVNDGTGSDAFVARLSISGALVYSTFLGGGGISNCCGVPETEIQIGSDAGNGIV